MALDKTTVEVPFAKGMNQKPRPEVTELDLPYMLRNVDLRKGTGLVKRSGRSTLSTTVIGPGSSLPTLETIARLANREDELVAICGSTGSWGSAGGAGAAGDTVFSYSPQVGGWKPFGKIGRPTSNVLSSAPPTDESLYEVDSASANGRLMTVQGRDTGIHVTIIDLETDTRIINNLLLSSLTGGIVCFAYDDKLFVLGSDSSDNLIGYAYDTDVHSAGFIGPTTIAANLGSKGFDVTTDGTYMYISFDYVAGGTHELRLVKVAPNLGNVAGPVTVDTLTAGLGGDNAIHYGTGSINIAWVDNTAGTLDVKLTRVTNGTTLTTSSAPTTVAAAVPLVSGVRVITQTLTESLVFWETIYDTGAEVGGLDGSGTPAKVWYRPVLGTVDIPVAASNPHSSVNVRFWAEPFILSTRVYLPVLGMRFVQPGSGPGSAGYYTGAYLTEVNPAATTNPTLTLMPVGANFLDIVGRIYGRKVSVVDNKAYITTTRRQNNPFDPDGQIYYVEYPIVSTVVYDFADFYRWQPANFKHSVLFSGALPYLFDGQNTYECGFTWRPEIRGAQVAAGSGLTDGQLYSYRATYEFRDHRGNRINSAPSYAVEARELAPTGGNLAVQLSVSIPSLSMKGDGSNYFPGKLYVVIWRANAGQETAGEYVRVAEERIHPYDQSNVIITDNETDDDVDAAERLYTLGGELENYTAPPCRVLFQHRDRLISYNTESKTVWYTKPMTPERGIEWSLSQQVPIAEDVIAGASLENAALLFTRTKVYALEGAGPGSNGLPPDGFSRLTLINADIGCSEDCGAWRTPAGILFRAHNGFWLVTRGYEFQYLGAMIEDEGDQVARVAGGVVDTSQACFRLYYQRASALSDSGSAAYCLNYWYDTGRWSRDDFAHMGELITGQELVSAVMWRGEPIHADTERVWFRLDGIYADASEFYPMGVDMGWARFGDLHAYKRIWRLLLTLKMFEDSRLQVTVARNYDDADLDEVEFSAAVVGTSPGQLRWHQRVQKVTSMRVLLKELQEGIDTGVQGFELFGIGFELGIKKGAVKLAATRGAGAPEGA